jgi:hypothetical protein
MRYQGHRAAESQSENTTDFTDNTDKGQIVLGLCCFIRVISEIRGLNIFAETEDFVPYPSVPSVPSVAHSWAAKKLVQRDSGSNLIPTSGFTFS